MSTANASEARTDSVGPSECVAQLAGHRRDRGRRPEGCRRQQRQVEQTLRELQQEIPGKSVRSRVSDREPPACKGKRAGTAHAVGPRADHKARRCRAARQSLTRARTPRLTSATER